MKSTEKDLIAIYNSSKSTHSEEGCEVAKFKSDVILLCFRLISLFTNCDHTKIVKQLYFNLDNLETAGEVHISNKTFVSVSTLYRYRNKYCLVISEILSLLDGLTGDDYDAISLSAFASSIK